MAENLPFNQVVAGSIPARPTKIRFIAIGPPDRAIVVVVYTERDEDRIRIIGARFANKREQDYCRSHMDQYR